MKLLETISLSIGYSREKTLQRELNFQARPGEIVSIMGQNGVGKTTFIKTITGLIPPISGTINLMGTSITSFSRNQIAQKLSVVLTEKPFALNMTVIELISMGRHPYSNWMGVLSSADREAIDWAIEETKVSYIAHRKLFELSDGQMQKVMIARALAQKTELIILDEPTAHLDLYNKMEVMFLLRKISKLGIGIIISTHDLQISTQLSDRLCLFNFNEPIQEGIPEDLILNGTLEKVLYLQDFGYDLVRGLVRFPTNQTEIAVSGPDPIKFWTEQALSRIGYKVMSNADLSIVIADNHWQMNQGPTSKSFASIADLLGYLKKLQPAVQP